MLFTVLGPVGVHVGGRRISLAHGHEPTASAVLVAADGDVVSADQLMPGSSPRLMRSEVDRGDSGEPGDGVEVGVAAEHRRHVMEEGGGGVDRVPAAGG